jgi:hypothetical protein
MWGDCERLRCQGLLGEDDGEGLVPGEVYVSRPSLDNEKLALVRGAAVILNYEW